MSRRLRSFAGLQAVIFALLVLAVSAPAWADAAADAIINKGIKAIGGEARLAKAKATTSKVKSTFISGDDASVSKIEQTTDGLDRTRTTVGYDFGTTVTVIDGDKGWRKEVMAMEGQELADRKWGMFWQAVPSRSLRTLTSRPKPWTTRKWATRQPPGSR